MHYANRAAKRAKLRRGSQSHTSHAGKLRAPAGSRVPLINGVVRLLLRVCLGCSECASTGEGAAGRQEARAWTYGSRGRWRCQPLRALGTMRALGTAALLAFLACAARSAAHALKAREGSAQPPPAPARSDTAPGGARLRGARVLFHCCLHARCSRRPSARKRGVASGVRSRLSCGAGDAERCAGLA